jgi:hypothetical protein
MTILEAITEVRNNMPTALKPTLVFADLSEANATIMDDIESSEVPVLLVLPFRVVDTPGRSGRLKSVANFTAFMLTKLSNPTTDYVSSTVETEAIAPMRLLARQFMHRLNEHSIIDSETSGITSITYEPIYGTMDANLFGITITASIPVMEQARVCVP